MTRNPVIVSVSLAQLRILQRLRRGERLPLSRYRMEHATMRALRRKGLVSNVHETRIVLGPGRDVAGWLPMACWELTNLGNRVAVARNGVLRDGEEPPRAPVVIDRTPPRHSHKQYKSSGRARRAS